MHWAKTLLKIEGESCIAFTGHSYLIETPNEKQLKSKEYLHILVELHDVSVVELRLFARLLATICTEILGKGYTRQETNVNLGDITLSQSRTLYGLDVSFICLGLHTRFLEPALKSQSRTLQMLAIDIMDAFDKEHFRVKKGNSGTVSWID